MGSHVTKKSKRGTVEKRVSPKDDARSSHPKAHRQRPVQTGCPFGPSFFGSQLRALIRTRCPDPAEAMPIVQIHLLTGETLDVCHVIGLAADWLALAVYDVSADVTPRSMRTELVPYTSILQITISKGRSGESHVGFNQDHVPLVVGQSEPEGGVEEVLARLSERPRRRIPAE